MDQGKEKEKDSKDKDSKDKDKEAVRSSTTPASLNSFFIYTTKLGQKEGREHEKILFYHVAEKDLDIGEKTKSVGLVETLVSFASSFSKTKPCDTLHTQRKRTVFFSPEPEYWAVLVVNNPTVTITTAKGSTTEWLEDELDDLALHSVLHQIYRLFKLFNGQFSAIVSSSSYDELKSVLASFLAPLLLSLNFSQLNLFTGLEGMHYLPVDRNIYLRIQSFINLVENSFSQIKYTCFLYRDHLVWSGLEQDEMQTLYTYMFPRIEEPPGRSEKLNRSWRVRSPLIGTEEVERAQLLQQQGAAATAAMGLIDPPRIFLDGDSRPLALVIYQRQQVTCVHIVDLTVARDPQFHAQVMAVIFPQMEFLAPIISEHYLRKPVSDDGYRFLYFNHMNLALKTSFTKKYAISKDVLRLLSEIHFDFERSPENLSEVMVKMANDAWLVGRKSDRRELFVLIEGRNPNLIEVTEEIRKLSSAHFGNIFIDWT